MILLDTNVLLHLANPIDPRLGAVLAAISKLRAAREVPCFTPQNVYEFWVAATRPLSSNGLGLSTSEVETQIHFFGSGFQFVPDKTGLFFTWFRLVILHQCKGKPAHDARLVAAMQLHGIDRILTFNVADFARYSGITAVDPASVP